jgi:hypothetical protein
MKWFQLDSDMPSDPRIRAVFRTLGLEGVGALTCLWCHVARHGSAPGRGVDSAGRPLKLEDLQEATHLDDVKFRRLIEVCIESGHFDAEVWRRSQSICIPAMQKRADRYARRRAARQAELPVS